MKLDFFKAVCTCQPGTGSARGEKPAVGLLGAVPDRSSQRAAGRPRKPVPSTERASAVGSVAAAGRLRRRPDPRQPSVREEGRRRREKGERFTAEASSLRLRVSVSVCVCVSARARPHSGGPGLARGRRGRADRRRPRRVSRKPGSDVACGRTVETTARGQRRRRAGKDTGPSLGPDPRAAVQTCASSTEEARRFQRGSRPGPPRGERAAPERRGRVCGARGAAGGRGHWRCEDFEAGNGTTEGGCSSDCFSCSPGFALSQ